jgi:hypothetical protein
MLTNHFNMHQKIITSETTKHFYHRIVDRYEMCKNHISLLESAGPLGMYIVCTIKTPHQLCSRKLFCTSLVHLTILITSMVRHTQITHVLVHVVQCLRVNVSLGFNLAHFGRVFFLYIEIAHRVRYLLVTGTTVDNPMIRSHSTDGVQLALRIA